ncbi:bile acid:sodium symporter [Glycocaulis alkaliphilus]|uniref:Bile acid:sodium symporter n=1 Tax=Glycocaulis alkaliphilus TaxID=1434191 RepID=A0A3T0EDB8_9PROT|nr:bile acid:sodium symporter family protein [Glycocaulis alkaliphilus]AZU05280.1 bile acid:sodium symporter [Glycocaulis alkaliphilus]GGB81894.1 symporter [Glycocaulis alkaliphilus]
MTDPASLDAVQLSLGPVFQSALPVSLAVIMFTVALSLRVDDFVQVMRRPVRFGGAAVTQILLLPMATLALVMVLQPQPSIALGMIVVACCPGGNMSNFFTHLGRGDTALSVSLTATSSLLAALATPVSILFWSGLYGPTRELMDALEVDAVPFVLQTMVILAVPLAAGMYLASRHAALARRLRPFMSGLAMVILVLIIAGSLAGNADLLLMGAIAILPTVIGHNAMALMLGYAAGWALRFDARGRRAMTIEVGIQNSGLGLVILLGALGGLGGAAAVIAVWGVWHLISGVGLAYGFRLTDHWRKKKTAVPASGGV